MHSQRVTSKEEHLSKLGIACHEAHAIRAGSRTAQVSHAARAAELHRCLHRRCASQYYSRHTMTTGFKAAHSLMHSPRLAAGRLQETHNLVGTRHVLSAVASCCKSAVTQTVGRQHMFECCGLLQVGWNTKLWAEEFALALEHGDGRFPRDQAAVGHNPPQGAGKGHGPASGRISAPLMRRPVTQHWSWHQTGCSRSAQQQATDSLNAHCANITVKVHCLEGFGQRV